MKAKSKRAVATAGAVVLMVFLAWLGGYDFDTRGPKEAYIFSMCVFIAVMIYAFPGWGGDE